jgi:hypothetical protein
VNDHREVRGIGGVGDDGSEGVGMELQHGRVHVGHHLDADLRDLASHHSDRHALRLRGQAADRKVLDPDVRMALDRARGDRPLGVVPEVADQSHAESFQRLDVGVGEALEAVGPSGRGGRRR